MVTFGVKTGAIQWLEDTQSPYDMLMDPDRNIYKFFGLKRSILRVWNISTLTYYAEQLAAERSLPHAIENIEDDPHQMGGDFVLNSSGNLTMIHCSKTPMDRPSVDVLIDHLKEHNE